jgi:hypothetical protein
MLLGIQICRDPLLLLLREKEDARGVLKARIRPHVDCTVPVATDHHWRLGDVM